ncbi:hypothetical protein SBA1_400043 [Candidatus Sulfotelmatobacter kueseliae]|uniref:Uncharacterized protein n=1 Tax=Candidatus Sulfotelmatobacter kueseliae TaxID=2042962 RepID=A0A2U3KQE9_9BACT|nr:hypothetical protein SBA1_400043 [Candidatus Sulfotelmatobacter kueseliae]
MHQHCGSVALFISQLAMCYGGDGKDSIAVLGSGTGLAQADNQVFDQLREMSRTLVVAKQNVVEFPTLFCPCQPVFDDTGNTALQYRAHSLLFQPGGNLAVQHLFPDQVGEFPNLERFHQDFVRFQEDSGHGTLHVGVAADKQRKRIRLRVAHRGDYRETVAGVRHVQVGDEYVKALGSDMSQSFCHAGGCDYFKTPVFKVRGHHVANGIVVIDKQNLVSHGWFVRSHTAQPLVTRNAVLLGFISKSV